ncbi:hypothetical protein IQ07DRAFT_468292, partial [Pyrenochaeta sp. DS3sAY3a]
SYFHLEQHRSMITAHIVLMTLAWIVFLPVGNIANSRARLPIQLIFTTTNILGALLGVTYSRSTPDLYENQKHSPIAWASIVFSLLWLAIMVVPNASIDKQPYSKSFHSDQQSYEALLQSSHPSSSELEREDQDDQLHSDIFDEADDTDEKLDTRGRFSQFPKGSFLSRVTAWTASKSLFPALRMLRAILDRIILILGFVCIVTGIVIYTGSFRNKNIFNGLAHTIKGGIFFWYGLLTFARWLGCLADFGWAWNLRPSKALVGSRAASMPSFEFIESATMCVYGVTNVWLEHLSNPGGKWEARDLEHVAIAFLFFGGGLIGVLLSSTLLRNLTTTHLRVRLGRGIDSNTAVDLETLQPDEQQQVSLNPIPAILVFLLGFMMSSHHQHSQVSSMLHMLWGKIFMAGTLARIATYALLYLRPPTSSLPSRPPTEVIASFCMIAGGLLLMLSNTDMIETLEYYDLDAMLVFTIVLALTAILMAWEVVCLAIKGWGQRRE